MIFAARRLTDQTLYLWPPSRTIKTITQISKQLMKISEKSIEIDEKLIKIKGTPIKIDKIIEK